MVNQKVKLAPGSVDQTMNNNQNNRSHINNDVSQTNISHLNHIPDESFENISQYGNAFSNNNNNKNQKQTDMS